MSSALVIDASVSGGWLFGDEISTYSDAVLATVTATSALAPSLWPYEIANILALAERRGRVTHEDVSQASRWLDALRVEIVPGPPRGALSALTHLAREHGLSAYDASYLELAIRSRSMLATLDQALRDAAVRAGVPLFVV